MQMMKRFSLFIILNILVIVAVSLITSALGLNHYLTAQGINYEMMAGFCLVWGMVGSFISLALSRVMAKMMMGVKVIGPEMRDPVLQDLVQTVHRLASSAGLPGMPQVGVYESPELNAFATGPSKRRSLVAVSTGLLQRMKPDEVEGVLAHEIAHIANGDMVTMTLIQGVVNAFVMFLSRAIAFAIAQMGRNKDDNSAGFSHITFMILVPVLEIFFMFLGWIVVAYFSRAREFRADSGGARYGGRDKMIGALQRLKQNYGVVDQDKTAALNAMMISGHKVGVLSRLFSTHPPLEVRIERLETMTNI